MALRPGFSPGLPFSESAYNHITRFKIWEDEKRREAGVTHQDECQGWGALVNAEPENVSASHKSGVMAALYATSST